MRWSKPSKSAASLNCFNRGTVNWNTGGSKPLLIMFKTGHALLLPGGRLLRPRSHRGGSAECPRGGAGSWPVTRSIRDCNSAVNQTRTQTLRGCRQSLSSFNPRQQARPRMFRVLDESTSLSVPEQAAPTDAKDFQLVRALELSTSTNFSHSRNVHAPRLGAQPFRRRLAAFTLPSRNFPVHIQNISGL